MSNISEGLLKISVALLLIIIVVPYIALAYRLISYFVTDPQENADISLYASAGGGGNSGVYVTDKKTLIYKFTHSDDELSTIIMDVPNYIQSTIGIFDDGFEMMLDKAKRPFEYTKSLWESLRSYISTQLKQFVTTD